MYSSMKQSYRIKKNEAKMLSKRRCLFLCTIASLGKLIDVLTRYYMGYLVDSGMSKEGITQTILCIIVIVIITIILRYTTPYANAKFEASYTADLFEKVEKAILFSEQSEIDNKNIGEISTCLTSDINGKLQFTRRVMMVFLPDVFSFTVCLVLLMRMKIFIGIVALIVGIFSVLLMTKLSKNMIRKMNEYQEILKKVNRLTSDGLFNVELIKVNNMERKLDEQYTDLLEQLQSKKRKTALRQAIVSAPSMVLSFATLISISIVGGYYVLDNQLSIGSLVAAITMSDYIVSPIMRFQNTLVQFRRSSVNTKNVLNVIEMSREKNNIENYYPSEECIIQDLDFMYNNDTCAFKHSNFGFKKGKINYLLGNNGAGKTTILKILTGVYEAHEGRILLPTGSKSREEIRKRISVMPQDALLFSDTIRQNILAGMQNMDAEMLKLWRNLILTRIFKK